MDINGHYEQKLNKLYRMQKQSHPQVFIYKIKTEGNLICEVLKKAQECKFIVNICIDSSELQESIIGFVNEIMDIDLVISRISENGSYDGESVILINDIVKLNCDSCEDQSLKLLSDDVKQTQR